MKIIIGAGGKEQEGWISIEQNELDITSRYDFACYLGDKRPMVILAEHVLEHIPLDKLGNTLLNIYNFLEFDGYFRIAVPDGFHKSNDYLDYVKPMGTGPGCDSHYSLFNYIDLSRMLEMVGFRVKLVEYWDEHGYFHSKDYKDEDGFIERSKNNDPRNQNGQLVYTSLIIDAYKDYRLDEVDLKFGLQKTFSYINRFDPRGISDFNQKRMTTLYTLASISPMDGVIVELGAYHGLGTIPLCYGSLDGYGMAVYSVDAYKEIKGWIGEPYGPEDESQWWNNRQKACIYPNLIKQDVIELSDKWTLPISLLVHDLGCKGRMPADILSWQKLIMPGGIIAMRDIDDYSMGTEDAVNNLISLGNWGYRHNWPAFYTSLRKL